MGFSLTNLGIEFLREWSGRYEIINGEIGSLGWEVTGLRIIEGEYILQKFTPVELRDMAVKCGADAALIIVYRKGVIEMPPMTVKEVEPIIAEIRNICTSCKENDVLILSSPQNPLISYEISIKLMNLS
ncbi:hypothetical protein HS7_19030 [Sulfolobales archaeon HS-7]|nr:hypothetical protein HS7_19030 [Sulfolobales archaeon HS-7]